MNVQEIVTRGLSMPLNSIAYTMSHRLHELYPDKAIFETTDFDFDLDEAVRRGFCTQIDRNDLHNESKFVWMGEEEGITKSRVQAFHSVTWDGYRFDVLRTQWQTDCGKEETFWIIAEAMEIAETFFRAVCEATSVVNDYVCVFENGGWHKSRDLHRSIKNATFDNLIMEQSLCDEIKQDLSGFFESEQTYAKYNIPWKRGVLFIGTPGNGKTHAIKALLNWLGRSCLYVKSLKARYDEHGCIREVFRKARQTTPCVLVMEDIDSLICDTNRAFFLNEMDGFASNSGILVVGTTNYPDRLDTAILDRPSRFDRKYHFPLPTEPLRLEYLRRWNDRIDAEMQVSAEALASLAAATDSYSFAYLKELTVASTMRWISEVTKPGSTGAASMECVTIEQSALLRSQMASTSTTLAAIETEAADVGEDDDDD